jgi:polyhydroxyalkanoate synthesis regulator phasin
LEALITSLKSSGFDSVSSTVLEKLDKLIVASGEIGMKEGKRLIENLSGAIKAIREEKSKAESGNIRLTALDFYVNNLLHNENIEDL